MKGCGWEVWQASVQSVYRVCLLRVNPGGETDGVDGQMTRSRTGGGQMACSDSLSWDKGVGRSSVCKVVLV
jgi:hypothetical protein